MSAMNRALGDAPSTPTKSKKTKGYWANGVWVKEQMALAEKAESAPSRAQDKVSSHARQDLGLAILKLRASAYSRLQTQGHVGERLAQVLADYRKITNFEGKRRQAQLIGKLMRALPDEAALAIENAIEAQASGSLEDAAAIHRIERWRDDLLAEDEALPKLLAHLQIERPDAVADTQHLRALVRQARKDSTETAQTSPTQPDLPKPMHKPSRARKELFQSLKTLLTDV